MRNIAKSLYNSALFKNKTEIEINNALSKIEYTTKCFDNEELIFRVDQRSEYIGIILEGSIEVQKNLASGRVISILNKKKGALFGEGSVFSKSVTYPCNIYSKNKNKILLISKDNMLKLIRSDSCLLNNFLSSFANRLLSLNLTTELLSYSSIQQKIAFSLLHMMNDYRKGNVINLPYSKKRWSEHLNVSRPSLFRELKELCNKKIISIETRNITILNESALANLLNN